jgi:uncharacterized surface protein with fasciclin (FAS1) repeats
MKGTLTFIPEADVGEDAHDFVKNKLKDLNATKKGLFKSRDLADIRSEYLDTFKALPATQSRLWTELHIVSTISKSDLLKSNYGNATLYLAQDLAVAMDVLAKQSTDASLKTALTKVSVSLKSGKMSLFQLMNALKLPVFEKLPILKEVSDDLASAPAMLAEVSQSLKLNEQSPRFTKNFSIQTPSGSLYEGWVMAYKVDGVDHFLYSITQDSSESRLNKMSMKVEDAMNVIKELQDKLVELEMNNKKEHARIETNVNSAGDMIGRLENHVDVIENHVSPQPTIAKKLEDMGLDILVGLLKASGVYSILDNERTLFTLFAPNDAAFFKINDVLYDLDELRKDKDQLLKVLGNHLIEGRNYLEDLQNKDQVETVTSEMLDVTDFTDGSIRVNGVNIVKSNIRCSNGVIQVIDGIILPANSKSKQKPQKQQQKPQKQQQKPQKQQQKPQKKQEKPQKKQEKPQKKQEKPQKKQEKPQKKQEKK